VLPRDSKLRCMFRLPRHSNPINSPVVALAIDPPQRATVGIHPIDARKAHEDDLASVRRKHRARIVFVYRSEAPEIVSVTGVLSAASPAGW
jgi:hypothetical protein